MHALAIAAVVALAAAAPIPPAPTRWVEDTAGFMSAGAREALDARLAAYERATGHQVVVWIGSSIGDAALDDWAVRTFAAWRVGRAGFDDGIVMFVLAEDRKIDIEVGYGLEGQVPDAVASRIIRETMAPKLRAGDRDAAITDGANAILTAIEGTPWLGVGAPQPPPAPAQATPLLTYILGGLALIAFLILLVTHPQ
ncbi:MAG TPA: TPM domain-containing protein, partial [Kofleriaceae bacterium]|nr:TPM domain-containing protein [Kofleriaceae bacterium]